MEDRSSRFIITDRENERIIELDRLTGMVWNYCDGEKSPWQIQTELSMNDGLHASEDDIWLSLTELSKMELLSNSSDDSIERYSTLLECEEESLTPVAA